MKPAYILLVGCLVLMACHPIKSLMVSPKEESDYYRPLSLKTPSPVSSSLDPFSDNLNRHYIRLSEEAWKKNDPQRAKFYAARALEITKGKTPDPLDIDKLHLADPTLHNLSDARQFLITSYGKNLRQNFPQGTARAQAMFDCWVTEIQNTPPSGIAYACPQRFEEARKTIEAFLKDPSAFAHLPKVPPPLPVSIMPVSNTMRPGNPVDRAVLTAELSDPGIDSSPVFGAFKRYRLHLAKHNISDPEVKNALDRIIDEALQRKPSHIAVIGHASNPDLAEKQVSEVTSYLLAGDLNAQWLSDLRAYDDAPKKHASVEIYFVH